MTMVYQDIFTSDILLSDRYAFTLIQNGLLMRVQASYQLKDLINDNYKPAETITGAVDNIPDDEAYEKVLDVQYQHDLIEFTFNGYEEFMSFIKEFVKRMKAYLEQQQSSVRFSRFQADLGEFIKNKIAKNFADYKFYTGVSEALNGSIVFSCWEDEEAQGPVFYYFSDALRKVAT